MRPSYQIRAKIYPQPFFYLSSFTLMWLDLNILHFHFEEKEGILVLSQCKNNISIWRAKIIRQPVHKFICRSIGLTGFALSQPILCMYLYSRISRGGGGEGGCHFCDRMWLKGGRGYTIQLCDVILRCTYKGLFLLYRYNKTFSEMPLHELTQP